MQWEAELDMSELSKLLHTMGARVDDMSDTMAVVAEQLVAAVADEFATGGHGAWPPLAERTHTGRRSGSTPHAIGPVHHQILVDTGALAGSQNPSSGRDWAEVSTDKFYAVFHVSDAPRKKIPLRNFYDLPESVYETAAETILEAVVR